MKIKALFRIINLHFWKSFFGPFFAFGFPIIFVGILGPLLGYETMFGGLLLVASTSVALTAMPQAIFEFKKSVLLKRIGVTPIRPWMFLAMAGMYYFGVMLIGTFFTLAMGVIIFSENLFVGKHTNTLVPVEMYPLIDMLNNIQWGGAIFGLVLNILIGSSLGMMLVSLAKSTLMIQGLSVPILIISQFLSGQVLPLDMVYGPSPHILWYLGYLCPFKSATSLFLLSWNPIVEFIDNTKVVISGGYNVFDINQVIPSNLLQFNSHDIFTYAERVLNLVLPFMWIGLFSTITIKKFKWSTR